jgi:hypothetical protein
MSKYPTIKSAPVGFLVTILGVVPPVIPRQVYYVSDLGLNIPFPSFKILPSTYDSSSLNGSFTAYILEIGALTPSQPDFSKLTPVAGWI